MGLHRISISKLGPVYEAYDADKLLNSFDVDLQSQANKLINENKIRHLVEKIVCNESIYENLLEIIQALENDENNEIREIFYQVGGCAVISFLLQSELESLKSFPNTIEQKTNSQKDFSQIGTAVHKYFKYFVNTPIRENETDDDVLDKSIQEDFVIIGENHTAPATSIAIPENLKYHNENESVEKKIKSSIKTQTQYHCLQLAAYAIYLALKK